MADEDWDSPAFNVALTGSMLSWIIGGLAGTAMVAIADFEESFCTFAVGGSARPMTSSGIAVNNVPAE